MMYVFSSPATLTGAEEKKRDHPVLGDIFSSVTQDPIIRKSANGKYYNIKSLFRVMSGVSRAGGG
jgi:hypothetical protein